MSGKNTGLTPLQSRKQLLLAESELNRIQLVADITTLTANVHALTGRAKSLGSVASSALALLAAFQGGRNDGGGRRRSWLQIILKGAGLVSTLWLAFRSMSRKQEQG